MCGSAWCAYCDYVKTSRNWQQICLYFKQRRYILIQYQLIESLHKIAIMQKLHKIKIKQNFNFLKQKMFNLTKITPCMDKLDIIINNKI